MRSRTAPKLRFKVRIDQSQFGLKRRGHIRVPRRWPRVSACHRKQGAKVSWRHGSKKVDYGLAGNARTAVLMTDLDLIWIKK